MGYLPRVFATIHPIGLGGAGTNVVETYLKDPRIIDRLAKTEDLHLSLLALDVADGDVRRLLTTKDIVMRELIQKGVTPTRIKVIAQSVKFPSPEAMFDFIYSKYPDFLKMDGIDISRESYKPIVTTSIEIPPLAGGVARKRSLSKSIYALNYYQLETIKRMIEEYKDTLMRNPGSNISVIIFGLGGGTGSGIIIDFARHLRKHAGASIPIIGLSILPVEADDPNVKVAGYIALKELGFLLSPYKNRWVTETFSKAYENPFYAFFFVPMRPVYNKLGSLQLTHEVVDSEIVDMLHTIASVDIADVLDHLHSGRMNDDSYITVTTLVKVYYPIDKYIEILKYKLEVVETLARLVEDKLNAITNIRKLLEEKEKQLLDIYASYLRETNRYSRDAFKELLNSIRATPQYARNVLMRARDVKVSLEEIIKTLYDIISNIEVKEGTTEYNVISLVKKLYETVSKAEEIDEFMKAVSTSIEDLKSITVSAPRFTPEQKSLINAFADTLKLLAEAFSFVKLYVEVTDLAKQLHIIIGAKVKSMVDEARAEANTLLQVINAITSTPAEESKLAESVVIALSGIIRRLEEELKTREEEAEIIESKLRRLRTEYRQVKSKLRGLLPFGKRKYKLRARELEVSLKRLEEEHKIVQEEHDKLKKKLDKLVSIRNLYVVTSEYRKSIERIGELEKQFHEELANISRLEKVFTRVAELSHQEQIRILEKLLMGKADELKSEEALMKILDKQRFNRFMRTIINQLKNPTNLGLKPDFRTDRIWVTVLSPTGLWSEDLRKEVEASLAGYIEGEVSRCIAFRETIPIDPWTISMLVMVSKVKPENLDIYEVLRHSYETSDPRDREFMRSFLKELGYTIEELEELYRKSVKKKR